MNPLSKVTDGNALAPTNFSAYMRSSKAPSLRDFAIQAQLLQWCPVTGPEAKGTNWSTGGAVRTSENTLLL